MADFDVVLSLTTWRGRLSGNNVLNTLKSLLKQSCDCTFKIVITIFRDDVQYINDNLRRFIDNNGIEILQCDLDLKSHKKYFYVMKKYRNKPIILFDDDLIYMENTVQLLWDNYRMFKKCVSSRRCRRIVYDNFGLAEKYGRWRLQLTPCKPSFDLLATTGGGTLIPPRLLDISERDIPMMMRTITSDDLFLKYKMNASNVPVSYVFDVHHRMSYTEQAESSDKESLCFVNIQNAKLNNLYIRILNIRDRTRIPERLIVSMTSWKKRIGNVADVVKCIFNGTVVPDRIVLNLSTDEFPEKTVELPKELVDLQNENRLFEINWVKYDTKPYKKLIPSLIRFPKDAIVTVDDDIDYPSSFCENLWMAYIANGRKYPVTANPNMWYRNTLLHYGAGSLVRKDMFGHVLWDIYNNLVVSNMDLYRFSDPVFTYSIILSGSHYVFAKCLDVDRIRKRQRGDSTSFSKIGNDGYLMSLMAEHTTLISYFSRKYNMNMELPFDLRRRKR